ncbi:MAG: toxin-antitoxin system YwqK family antitoxin [Candidatus Saganbacteria bacterium]|nr:toxin-antitoxin system YwqK family antitoxin [Candidatus Saganbacteria bacterium]
MAISGGEYAYVISTGEVYDDSHNIIGVVNKSETYKVISNSGDGQMYKILYKPDSNIVAWIRSGILSNIGDPDVIPVWGCSDGSSYVESKYHPIPEFEKDEFSGSKMYYDSKKLNGEGLISGERKIYDADMHLLKKQYYINGLIEGKSIEYNSDGTTLEVRTFKNGKLNGQTIEYSRGLLHDGKPIKISNYKDWELDGKSGGANYKNGELHGEQRSHYDNGKVESICNYKNGELHGVRKDYYENGRLCYVGQYLNGVEVGIWKYYYDNGRTRRIENKNTHMILEEYDENGRRIIDIQGPTRIYY